MKQSWVFILLLVGTVLHSARALEVRDLGIPVKGVSWVRLHPGQTDDGKPSLLASMSQNNGGLFVVDINLETGHCRQFPVSDTTRSTFTTAAFRSQRTGILYIGSAWDGHLHRFDANHPERGIEDLGKIDPAGAANFPTGITEGSDGVLWIGSPPGARLIKYDPATGVFTRYGRMDETDEYLYPLAGDDGTLAALVKVVRPHVVLIDPATGEHREVGPAITDTTDQTQFLKLRKGLDGRLYLDSHAGQFRVDGLTLTPVTAIPAFMPGTALAEQREVVPLVMPGGWTAKFLDDNSTGAGTPRTILLTNTDPQVPSRQLTLDWVGGGSNLFVFDVGPGGDLYGTSYLPNHLFRASPDGAVVEDLGKLSFAMGEAYSLTTRQNQVWLASYPMSRLSVYDPAKPLHFGTSPEDNPRDLGQLDNIACRPNALITTPDGRLWMGSGPDYGLIGGTLAWLDPSTGEKKSHRAIVPDTSPSALMYLPGLKQILVGLSIEGGTGTKVRRLTGAFALWDPAKDELVWSGDLGLENLADITALADADHGLIYALIGRGDHILSQGAPEITPRLALIDPARRTVIASAWLPKDFGPLPWTGHFALRVGPDAVYGATAHCVFRIKPGTCEVERIWQESQPRPREGTVWLTASDPNIIDVVGPIIGHKFYFASGWRLRVLTLPGEPAVK